MEEYQGEEQNAEIVAWYIPWTVSAGHEAQSFKKDLLGAAFPIRQYNARYEGQWKTYDQYVPEFVINDPEKIIIVTGEDVVKALRIAGRGKAAIVYMILKGFFGADIRENFMVFERNKGYLLSPVEMAQKFPKMAGFDEPLPS